MSEGEGKGRGWGEKQELRLKGCLERRHEEESEL